VQVQVIAGIAERPPPGLSALGRSGARTNLRSRPSIRALSNMVV